MADKVSCAICARQMTYINNKHLASHGITAKEYHAAYPGRPLMTKEVADRLSMRSVKANASRKGVPRTPKDLAAVRAGLARRPSRVGIKTGPMSQAQKDQLSVTKKAMYADGTLVPYLKGKKQPEAIKQAISRSLQGRRPSEESKRKKLATYTTNRDAGLHKSQKGKTLPLAVRQKIGLKTTARFERERLERRSVMLPRIAEAGLQLLNAVDAPVFELVCAACGHQFTRTPQCFQPSKFHTKQCDQCFPISPRSDAEIELCNFVQSLMPDTRIIISDMEVIGPLELDIFVPEFKIAIEYCGLYWHSENAGKHRWYHRRKMETCETKGIRLITVFEDEWINQRAIAENMIRNAFGLTLRQLDARKCRVGSIDPAVVNAFLKANHIQGRGRSVARYGLFFGDELVSVMTFADSGISRNLRGWEINRFCSKIGCSVRGGASRLFKAFVKDHAPDTVLTYADLRWGPGSLYGVLGFECIGWTVPNYWYFRAPEIKRLHRYALRKMDDEPADQTEWQLRVAQGWNRIWDCGHAKWVWRQPR